MKIVKKKGWALSKKEKNLMLNSRIKEYGENDKDFDNEEKKSLFFFVKNKKEIVAFGMLKPIKINYLNKNYKILGIGNILSIKKGMGYGKVLMDSIIKYLRRNKKTGIGFCSNNNTKFYEKSGLKVKKRFSKRFALENPTTKKRIFDSENCAMIYYEGKDNLLSKMFENKSVATYFIPNMSNPHW